jgi:sulfur transfer complex TusBCD TusB component (DsrH family)
MYMRFLILALLLAGCANPQEFSGKISDYKVLVIGDSISLGYTPYVANLLKSSHTVTHAPGNSRSSGYTLANVDSWTTQCYDVILWNNGIWDTSSHPDYACSLAQYEANLIAIANKLKLKAPKVKFLTTTRLFPNGYNYPELVDQFNQIAWRVLPPLGVEVYDFHAVSLTFEPYDKTHYNSQEYSYFSGYISNVIKN